MNAKLPHEYLQSPFKEKFEIVFTIKDNTPFVTLILKDKGMTATHTEKITSVETIGDHIRSSESKIIKAINYD